VFPAAYVAQGGDAGNTRARDQAYAANVSAAADVRPDMDGAGDDGVEEGRADGEEEGSGEEDMSGYRVVLYTESAFMDGVLLICGEWLLSSAPDQVRR
jgi:hypothetical protein